MYGTACQTWGVLFRYSLVGSDSFILGQDFAHHAKTFKRGAEAPLHYFDNICRKGGVYIGNGFCQ